MFVMQRTIRYDYSLIFMTQRTIRHDYTLTFMTRQTIRRDYTLMFVTQRTIRHDYNIIFVMRQTVRHDYILMFMMRRTIRRDYTLMFVTRRTVRHDYTLMFVTQQTVRHDYIVMFVMQRTVRHDYTFMFVTRRTILRQSYGMNHTRNSRGGACVPARTSAQRRFHQQRACPHPQRSRFHLQKVHSTYKNGISIHKRYMLIPKHVCAFADECALMGRRGRAHRHRPYQPPSNPSTTQSSLILCIGELFFGNFVTWSHMRNGRGDACVPARTSAQRRFHA